MEDMRWNPFSHLSETKKYSSGRILRSGLWHRIEDTFRVFYGDLFNVDENELGILDYPFPFPRILQNILYMSFKNATAMILVGIFAVPLIATKFIAASMLTLISLPIVGLTHLFVMPTINKLLKRVQQIKVTLVESEKNEDKSKELGQIFSTEKMRSILIIPIEKIENKTEFDKSDYTLASNHSHGFIKKANPDRLALGIYEGRWKLGENPISHSEQPKAIIEITLENKKGIKALLKTNMFKATTYLENEELLGVLEEKLQPKKRG